MWETVGSGGARQSERIVGSWCNLSVKTMGVEGRELSCLHACIEFSGLPPPPLLEAESEWAKFNKTLSQFCCQGGMQQICAKSFMRKQQLKVQPGI